MGGNAAAVPGNILGEGEDIDPIEEVNGSDASEGSAAGGVASTVSSSHPTEEGDRDNQSEVATPTSLRREEHRPEGTSNEDLDITTSSVTCSEGHPMLLSAQNGVFCASINPQNVSTTSQSGDQAIAPHLESVRETDESLRGISQNDASNTTTALEYHLPHTEDSNSLSHSSHVPVAPIGTNYPVS